MTRGEIIERGEVADCEAGNFGYTYDPHADADGRWTCWLRPNGRHVAISMLMTPSDGWEIRNEEN